MPITITEENNSSRVISMKDAVPGKFYVSVHPGPGGATYEGKIGICTINFNPPGRDYKKLQLIDNTDHIANEEWLVQEVRNVNLTYSV